MKQKYNIPANEFKPIVYTPNESLSKAIVSVKVSGYGYVYDKRT